MKFVKMHGIGNDYVFVDGFETALPNDPAALSIAISKPHFGIGSDGLILMERSETCDAKMRIFNADGSEAEMCGNGLRCCAKYLFDAGRVKSPVMTIETGAGSRGAEALVRDGRTVGAVCDMGEPDFDPLNIPLSSARNRVFLPLSDGALREFLCLSMGNPHAVTFLRRVDPDGFLKDGPMVETAPCFPRRVNAEFVETLSRTRLRARIWERGSGATLACGTGACACLVAGVCLNECERKAEIELPGGTLIAEWKSDNHVYLAGSAEYVFTGEWPD